MHAYIFILFIGRGNLNCTEPNEEKATHISEVKGTFRLVARCKFDGIKRAGARTHLNQ